MEKNRAFKAINNIMRLKYSDDAGARHFTTAHHLIYYLSNTPVININYTNNSNLSLIETIDMIIILRTCKDRDISYKKVVDDYLDSLVDSAFILKHIDILINMIYAKGWNHNIRYVHSMIFFLKSYYDYVDFYIITKILANAIDKDRNVIEYLNILKEPANG